MLRCCFSLPLPATGEGGDLPSIRCATCLIVIPASVAMLALAGLPEIVGAVFEPEGGSGFSLLPSPVPPHPARVKSVMVLRIATTRGPRQP